jgi:hypothetical protein
MDATVDIHQELGTISRDQVWLQDIFITIRNGAVHMPSLHAITTQLESTDLVEPASQPQNAQSNAQMTLEEHTLQTCGTLVMYTVYHQMFKKFKLNS